MYYSASHWQRWVNPSLFLNGQAQREITAGNLSGPIFQGLKNSPILFYEILSVTLLPFCQRFLHLQYVDDLLLASKTKINYKRITGGMLQESQTRGYLQNVSYRSLDFFHQRLPILATSWGEAKIFCLRAGLLPSFGSQLQRLRDRLKNSQVLPGITASGYQSLQK